MFSSRGLLIGRAVRQVFARKALAAPVTASSMATRLSHHWSYRTAPPPASKATVYTAEVIAACMWWWVLWHLWHEYEHITGEFEYPDPSKWTDAELGIPADRQK